MNPYSIRFLMKRSRIFLLFCIFLVMLGLVLRYLPDGLGQFFPFQDTNPGEIPGQNSREEALSIPGEGIANEEAGVASGLSSPPEPFPFQEAEPVYSPEGPIRPIPEEAANASEEALGPEPAEPVIGASASLGQLIVRANVPNAIVYIDGVSTGVAGPMIHAVAPGEHMARVEKTGYEPFETAFSLTPGEREVILARLTPLSLVPSPMQPKRPGSGEEETVVEMIRYPVIDVPDQARMGQEFQVRVSLTKDPMAPEPLTALSAKAPPEGEGEEPSIHPPGKEQWPIDVVLSAPGFQYPDTAQDSSLRLYKDLDATWAVFRLRADPIPVPKRVRRLFITFLHQGSYLAEVTREIEVINNGVSEVSNATRGPAPDAAGAGIPGGPALSQNEPLRSSIRVPDQEEITRPSAPIPARNETGEEERPPPPPEKPLVFRLPVPALSVFKMSRSIGGVPLSETAPQQRPDLTVLILHGENVDNRSQTEITICSPHLGKSQSKWQGKYIQPELSPWLDKKYAELSHPDTQGSDGLIPSMIGLGRDLYQEYAPGIFKQAFWELVDKLGEDFQSIQIVTNASQLPWELMRPSRPDGTQEKDFLGAQYRIARWHRPLIGPPKSLPLSEIAVIAPEYSEGTLPWRTREIEALAGMTRYRGIPGRYGAVRALFGDPPLGIVHFAGHGLIEQNDSGKPYEGGYFISLEDRKLESGMLKDWTTGDKRALPLFFFNANQADPSPGGAQIIDGWAPALLGAGASGYIGALWPVGDKGAAEFSIRFYRMLEEKLAENPTATVSEILQKARRLFLKEGDPTYLAYVFYGDPNFRLIGEN
uniref:PEGA domain-containing protein n=1 Tax=Candidatus Kentrum sp. DK TaxID=2126562 RepID=A0A450SCV2_9GAMM|nr:MAG: PEGA domain-containing protein [Candidatus Kentron sp. DK]